jgi:hypothetical protein
VEFREEVQVRIPELKLQLCVPELHVLGSVFEVDCANSVRDTDSFRRDLRRQCARNQRTISITYCCHASVAGRDG